MSRLVTGGGALLLTMRSDVCAGCCFKQVPKPTDYSEGPIRLKLIAPIVAAHLLVCGFAYADDASPFRNISEHGARWHRRTGMSENMRPPLLSFARAQINSLRFGNAHGSMLFHELVSPEVACCSQSES
jgi:hypothetical protein